MQIKKIILPLVALLFSFGAVQAQKGSTKISIQYNVGIPTGSFKDMISETSARGFKAEVLYSVSDKLSVGLGTGFQDFYQKNSRRLYKLSDGSDVSAVLSHSIQTIPVMAQARYQFNAGAAIQPYAALAAGGNLIAYSELLGEFNSDDAAKFGFAARPEAGVYIPFRKNGEAGLLLGASYNIMPFNYGDFKNLNNLGVHAGVTLPLRR